MKNQKTVLKLTIVVFSAIFFVISFSIIGPILASFMLGHLKENHEVYGFHKKHAITSITIGELSFFIIAFFIINHSFDFHNPIIPYIIIYVFVLTYIFSLLFYYIGLYMGKTKNEESN